LENGGGLKRPSTSFHNYFCTNPLQDGLSFTHLFTRQPARCKTVFPLYAPGCLKCPFLSICLLRKNRLSASREQPVALKSGLPAGM